jgi:hypothetical protein
MSDRTPAEHAATVRDLRRDIIATLIAVKGHLDTPYPDDDRWTPWTRFVERALRDVDVLAERATELERRLLECGDSFDLVESRAAELERERDEAVWTSEHLDREGMKLRERIEQLERDLFAARQAVLAEGLRAEQLERGRMDLISTAADYKERAEQLETALRPFVDYLNPKALMQGDVWPARFEEYQRIARAALGETAP